MRVHLIEKSLELAVVAVLAAQGMFCVYACFGQEISEKPIWFDTQADSELSPSNLVLSYLRLLEEGWYEAAFDLLSPEYQERIGGNTSQFSDVGSAQQMDWHSFADVVLKADILASGDAQVFVRSFVASEGYFYLQRFDFDLVREKSRWRISSREWGPSILMDGPLPAGIWGMEVEPSRMHEARDGFAAIASDVKTGSPAVETQDAKRELAAPPWLGFAEGGFLDTNPSGAVNGYARALAESRYDLALYYLPEGQRSITSLGGFASNEMGKAPLRFYSGGDDIYDEDSLDDSHAIVKSIQFLSSGGKLFVRKVDFGCAKEAGRWKVKTIGEANALEIPAPTDWRQRLEILRLNEEG